MFDDYARQLIDRLPELPSIDRAACRRALSSAYFKVVQVRLGLESPAEAADSLKETRALLRQMADALESVAVFDRLSGVPAEPGVEEASAFVAAEAVALLAALPEEPQAPPENEDEDEDETQLPVEPPSGETSTTLDDIQIPRYYLAVESALLYLIAGYEVNAAALVRDFPRAVRTRNAQLREARRQNANYLLGRLHDLCTGHVVPPRAPVPYSGFAEAPTEYGQLVEELRLWTYLHLSNAITSFLSWLGGYAESLSDAIALVEKVRKATSSSGALATTAGTTTSEFIYADLADVHHLASILTRAFQRLSERSLIHSIPPPNSTDPVFLRYFNAYLSWRARGREGVRGRPYLWPSALDYIRSCLPGPNCDAVIAMPTGSGKSLWPSSELLTRWAAAT